MKSLLTIWTVVLLVGSLVSCEEKASEKRHPGLQDLWECYEQSDWSDEKIATHLTGKWRWFYTDSPWVTEGHFIEDENLVLHFRSDSTLQVLKDGRVKKTVDWRVVPKNEDFFRLELSESVSQLYGFIVICRNTLVFNDSYRDGTDDYFERIEPQSEKRKKTYCNF